MKIFNFKLLTNDTLINLFQMRDHLSVFIGRYEEMTSSVAAANRERDDVFKFHNIQKIIINSYFVLSYPIEYGVVFE